MVRPTCILQIQALKTISTVSVSKKTMVLPTAAASSAAANGGAATLPAAALLTHLTTMRRSVREIFNPHAADAAGALADANSALQAMARLIK